MTTLGRVVAQHAFPPGGCQRARRLELLQNLRNTTAGDAYPQMRNKGNRKRRPTRLAATGAALQRDVVMTATKLPIQLQDVFAIGSDRRWFAPRCLRHTNVICRNKGIDPADKPGDRLK